MRTRAVFAHSRVTLGAAAVVLLVLGAPLLFGRFYFGTDLQLSDVGLLCALRHQLAHGDSLLVSRLVGNGFPLALEPTARVAYPLRWLALAFPPDLGASLEAVLHLALGAGGAAGLGRTFGLRPRTALAAGVVYAVSGTATDAMFHTVYVVPVAWMPVAWAAARSFLYRRGGAAHLAITFAAGLSILLGGEPQGFALASAVVGGECLFAARSTRPRWRALLPGLAIVAAFPVGAALWLSVLAEMALGDRGQSLALERAVLWSLNGPGLLAMVHPDLLNASFGPGFSLAQLWAGRSELPNMYESTFWNSTPYFGWVLLVLVFSGLGRHRGRAATAVFFVSWAAALGDTLGLLPLAMRLFPPLAMFRYPEKYLVLTQLAAAVAGMVALEEATRSQRGRQRLLFGLGVVVVLELALVLGLFGARDTLRDRLVEMGSTAEQATPLVGQLAARAGRALVPVALAAAFLLGGRRLWPAVLLLIPLDHLQGNGLYRGLGPGIASVASPLGDVGRGGPEPPIVCLSTAAPIEVASGDVAAMFADKRRLLTPTLNACEGAIGVEPYSPLEPRPSVILGLERAFNFVQTYRARGCTHIVGPLQPQGEVELEGSVPWASGRLDIHRILSPIPEAFTSRGPRFWADEDTMLIAVRQARSAPETLAVVDRPLGRGEAPILPGGDGIEGVAVEWKSSADLVVTARGRGGAVLGARTTYYRGWTAEQSGRPLEVVRVGGMFLGAIVPDVTEGPVHFRYQPPRRLLGAASAVFGLLFLCGLLFIARQPRSGAWPLTRTPGGEVSGAHFS